MTSENEKPQKFGLTFKELSERSTVYRDNLMKGHSVMITGAGSGIGKAMAFLYARLGANVSICGRTEEKLKNVATELEDRCGKEIFWKVSNVRNPEEMESFLDEITDKFGKIDTVINNAGGQFVQDAIDFSRKGLKKSITFTHTTPYTFRFIFDFQRVQWEWRREPCDPRCLGTATGWW